MKQKFDFNSKYKRPNIKLCKPNRQGVGYINAVHDLKIKLCYNAVSELSFTIFSKLDDEKTPYYDLIKSQKLIFTDEYGYFIIQDVNIKNDGVCESKDVAAVSAEYELVQSKLSYLNGTFKFYNPLNAKDSETIIDKFLISNPLWNIGNIDSDLWDIYRTYDISDNNWYQFLLSEVEKNNQCIFKFDNVKRIISAYSFEKSIKDTGIYISNKNLLMNLDIDDKSDEVFTALNCFGAGNLDVARVNPLGTNSLYNFDYFKTTEWMSQDTIDALNTWESKLEAAQSTYIELLTTLRKLQANLIDEKANLVELDTSLKASEVVIAAKISQGINNDAEYHELVVKKDKIVVDIANKKAETEQIQINIDKLLDRCKQTNKSLSFADNFTPEQIETLNSLTIIDDYQNDSFIKTDKMTEVEIQDQSLALFNHCKSIIKTISSPRYYFSGQLVNFIFLEEFKKFTDELELGCKMRVQIKKGWTADLILLSMTLDFDNPDNFPLEFSNRQRLDNGDMTFSDIYNDNSIASKKVNWDSLIWGEPVKSGQMSQVSEFMSNNFNAAKNALLSAKGIGVMIDGSGIHLRRYLNEVLQPNEIWMIDDMIALSGDNFNTPPKIAIGRFKLPWSENMAFGINAEFLAGYLICGNNFIFENRDKDSNITQFRFDANGAYLYNSSITIENDKSQVILNPNNKTIFTISGRTDRTQKWEPKIYMDDKGNANFIGKITADEGIIAGWVIKKNGISSSFGDYLRSDGYAKLGLLTLTPNSGTFAGNVYAKNLFAGVNVEGGSGSNSDGTGSKDYGWIGNGHIKNGSISSTKLEYSYTNGITNSLAEIRFKANQNESSITSLTNYTTQQVNRLNSDIVEAHSSITQLSNRTEASITSLTNYTSQQISRLNSDIVNANSSISQLSNRTESSISSLTSYTHNEVSRINGQINSITGSVTNITQTANANGANITMLAQTPNEQSNRIASIEVATNNNSNSYISLNADVIYLNGQIRSIKAGSSSFDNIRISGSLYVDSIKYFDGHGAQTAFTNYVGSHTHSIKIGNRTYTTSSAGGHTHQTLA